MADDDAAVGEDAEDEQGDDGNADTGTSESPIVVSSEEDNE